MVLKLNVIVLVTTLRQRISFGFCMSDRATVSPKFVKKVEARVAKIGFVVSVIVASEGSGGSAKNTSNDKCTSNRLLNESSVATLDVIVIFKTSFCSMLLTMQLDNSV